MTDILMRAPIGAATTIHASGSGRAYSLREDATVDVDPKDVGDLIRMGYSPVTAIEDPVAADAARVREASEAALALHGA